MSSNDLTTFGMPVNLDSVSFSSLRYSPTLALRYVPTEMLLLARSSSDTRALGPGEFRNSMVSDVIVTVTGSPIS